ncbi:MAG: electron transfer flavoprotein subunit alpha/FixB family protein [Pseudomonadota bacterium]
MTNQQESAPIHSSRTQRARSILVVCETWENELTPLSVSLVGHGRRVADDLNGWELEALVSGDPGDLVESLGPAGADRITRYRSVSNLHDPDLIAVAVCAIHDARRPELTFLARSPWTMDVAPRIAAALKAPLVSNCVGPVRFDTSRLEAVRSIHGGRLHQPVYVENPVTAVISWHPDALGSFERIQAAGVVIEDRTPPPMESVGIRHIRVVPGDPETVAIDDADRILAFGRGVDPADLPRLRELARLLGASMAGTRPVVDSGSIPFERQIGQTGAKVSPRLLLAWGISGANEFTVGIEESGTVVAINNDTQARIFTLSDVGIVGDAAEIMDELLKSLSASAGTSPELP